MLASTAVTATPSELRTIRSLLSKRDAAAIADGVKRAVAAGGSTVDALLHGTTYDANAALGWRRWRDVEGPLNYLPPRSEGERVEGRGTVVPGDGLGRGNGRDAPWRLHATLALISRGSGAVAASLRKSITSLVLTDAEDLTLYDGLTALRTLHARGENLAVAGLAKLPRLRELILSGSTTDLRGIEGAPSLTTLWASGASDLTPLRGLPRLIDLNLIEHGSLAPLDGLPIERLECDNVLDLGDMPELRELLGVSGDLTGLRSAPRLESLFLCDDPRDLTHLPPLPALSAVRRGSLSDRSIPWFPMLPALEYVHELDLSSWACLAQIPSVRRAGGVSTGRIPLVSTAGVPDGFEISPAYNGVLDQFLGDASRVLALGWRGEDTRLESIADLGGVRGFDSLSLAGCKLKSLDGLAGSTISRLYLHDSTITTLDGIEGVPLEVLDLRDCLHLRDARALADMTTLRVIAAAGCALPDEGFPEAVRWAIRREPRPDFAALVQRVPKRDTPRKTRAGGAKPNAAKAPRGGASAVDTATWAAVQVALSEGRFDDAVDRALRGGAAVIDRLLRDLRYRETKAKDFQLVANELTCAESYREHVLLRLVGEAPPECTAVTAVRDRVTALRLDARLSRRRPRAAESRPIDLTPLSRFPNLVRVDVRADELHGLEALAACRKLEELRIDQSIPAPQQPERTLAFAAGTALRRLELPGLRSLDGIEATKLEEVGGDVVLRGGMQPRSATLRVLSARLEDAGSLASLPALEKLHARLHEGDRELRIRHAKLHTLDLWGEVGADCTVDVRGLPSLTEVDVGLAGCPTLRLPPSVQLLVVGADFTDFAILSELPRLRTLVLPEDHPLLGDVRKQAASHPTLQNLESQYTRHLLWERAQSKARA